MKKMIAYCGLDCAICPTYLATQKDDDNMRQQLIDEWKKNNKVDLKLEDVNCDGCKNGGRILFFCRHCRVKKCGDKKKVENCAYCEEYVCRVLKKEFNSSLPETIGKENLDEIHKNLTKSKEIV